MVVSIVLAAVLTVPAGQIAYLAPGPAGSAQVSIVDIGTLAVTPLGPGRDDGPPAWAPDGQRLAFETTDDAGRRVIAVASPGGPVERIRHYYDRNHHAVWSPDGKRLAYAAGDDPKEARMVVYDFASKRESVWGDDTRGLMQPAWLGGRALELFIGAAEEFGWREGAAGTVLREASRQGALIAVGFVALPNGGIGTDLFVVTQSAAVAIPDIVLASRGAYDEWAPATHPREERIAFESNDGGDREIMVLSFRSGTFDLSNHRMADWGPIWTPDRSWLAFESFRSGRRGLYRANVSSVRVEPLAASEDHDNWGITFDPSGGAFAFVSNREGVPALFVQEGPGASPQRIEVVAGPVGAPAWRPVP